MEGVLDVHVLRSQEIGNVAALGGSTATQSLFERLHGLGVEELVLAFDNDAPGRLATSRAIETAVRSGRSPDLWIIDPDLLAPYKDLGELVRAAGPDHWHATTAAPLCGVTWRALDLSGPLDQQTTEVARRAGLSRAGSWLGTLPLRVAVEQAAALDAVADTSATTAKPCNERSPPATGSATRTSRHHDTSTRSAADASVADGDALNPFVP